MTTIEAAFNEKDCLATDPFEGDFGDQDDRTLTDKIVRPRIAHIGACHDCAGDVVAKSPSRYRVDIFDGQMFTFRWCTDCCSAQALSWTDDGKAWERRISLGLAARKQPA